MALVKPVARCGKALVFNCYFETQIPGSIVRARSSHGATVPTDAEFFIHAAIVTLSLCHGSIPDY